jgi:hypothetical protein
MSSRKNYKEFFMKKACLILLVLAIGIAMSCTSGPAAVNTSGMPSWVNDIPPEDALWGIGVAKMADMSMQLTTSEERGRVAIARQLDSKVQAMFTDYNLAAGPAGNQATTSLQENVSRNITNMNVSGARAIKRETIDGSTWTLVEYKKSDAKTAVASLLRNEEAAYAQFKAQQALDMLDAQLAKNEAAQRVSN